MVVSRIHYFNPGHETAVLLDTECYTPPLSVRTMMRDLSCLPMWYAEGADYVLTDEIAAQYFPDFLPEETEAFAHVVSREELREGELSGIGLEAEPWGLSPHVIKMFQDVKRNFAQDMSVPVWKECYAQLTGRQTAAECLLLIRREMPEMTFPPEPQFCRKTEDVEAYMCRHRAPFVVKTPYSSSGRGLLWLSEGKMTDKDRKWIEGAIRKQGMVSVERALDKVQDFALEFYSDGEGHVRYEGLSVFETNPKGAYMGNLLGSPEHLCKSLERWGFGDLTRLQQAVCNALSSLYGHAYRGYLGVDMMVHRTAAPAASDTFAIHPCVEINMRHTMGLLAMRLSQRILASGAVGKFCISCDKAGGETFKAHCRMKKEYPLAIEGGRIRSGYLALCPVTKDTVYRAYILVS